jgi:NitT/TauT family transport system substrate-binding protein
MSPRLFLMVSALFAATISSGACRTEEAVDVGGDGPELRRVRVGLPVAASTFLPLYMAAEDDLFADEGLRVELVSFRGGSDLVRAVVAGSVDMGVTSLAGVTVGIAAGSP